MSQEQEIQIAEVVKSILDEVISRCSLLNHRSGEEPPLAEIVVSDIRKAKSIGSVASSDAGDLSSFSDDDSEIGLVESGDDSELEFEQYLAKSKTLRHKNFMKEHCWQFEAKKTRKEREPELFHDEYENWPDFERLSINCSSSKPKNLQPLGTVENMVGCVALLKPDAKLQQIMDLETVIFDKEGDVLGTICDIVGTVRSLLYCFKPKGDEEKEKLAMGMEVYYAPAAEGLTKKLIELKLQNNWDREMHSDEEDIVFSDDEKERQYVAAKKAKKAAVQANRPVAEHKRTHNRVQFQETASEQPVSQPSEPSRGRGRGRGGGGWRGQRPVVDFTRSYPSMQNDAVVEPVADPEPAPEVRRELVSTENNPYAEFGCYDTYATAALSKNIYRKY